MRVPSAGPSIMIVVIVAMFLVLAVLLWVTDTPDPPQEFESRGTRGNPASFTVDTPDGRRVVCISWNRMEAGGLSCDWAGATRVQVESK